MEVKPGYKQTLAGIVPADWELKQIGDLKPFVTSGSRGWATFYSERGSPFIRITNLSRDHICLDLDNLRFVNIDQNESEAARTQLQNGDILISITADIGMIGYVSDELSKPAYINQHIALVRFDPSRINSKFVSYFLTTEKPQQLFRFLTDAGAKAGMNLTTVQQIQIVLPPTITEQNAIAKALSDGDALIEALEQLIGKKRQIKQGAMQELLSGKRRLPGFMVKTEYKHTEVGLIPEDWRLRRLHSLLTQPATYGVVKAGMFQPRGIPMLRGGDIKDGRINTDLPFISREKSSEYQRTVLRTGDVVIALVGYPGQAAVIPPALDGANISRAIGLLRPGDALNAGYLTCYLNSTTGRTEFLKPGAGSAQMVVNLRDLNLLWVSLPPTKAEQKRIAAVLSDMDAEIAALEAKLTKARHIKQGMMQELLSGRTRLI
jgi:type I restriction enzyme S subunit